MSRKIGAVFASLLTLTFAAAILLRVLTGGKAAAPAQEHKLTVVAATYPIYLFTCALTEDVDNITVERLDTGSVSCLHDYTLSMRDMQKIESADLIAVNGAGLEEFLEHALETSDAQIVDCSQGIALLESLSHGHDGHDHAHGHHHHHADEVFASWGRETAKTYEKEQLEHILGQLSREEEYGIVLRAKGMVPDSRGTWLYFDMVPDEVEIRTGEPEYTGRLCVIGSELKEAELEKLFLLV